MLTNKLFRSVGVCNPWVRKDKVGRWVVKMGPFFLTGKEMVNQSKKEDRSQTDCKNGHEWVNEMDGRWVKIGNPPFQGKGKGLFDHMEMPYYINLTRGDLEYIRPYVEAKCLIPNDKRCQMQLINKDTARRGVLGDD